MNDKFSGDRVFGWKLEVGISINERSTIKDQDQALIHYVTLVLVLVWSSKRFLVSR